MDTKERKEMMFKIMEEPIEAVREFNKEMEILLNKHLNNQELKDEVNKLKNKIKKKYNTRGQ